MLRSAAGFQRCRELEIRGDVLFQVHLPVHLRQFAMAARIGRLQQRVLGERLLGFRELPAFQVEAAQLEEASRHVWSKGDITFLLPPEEGWHRVRSAGPGDGVSVHVLCRTPTDHPHRFWDRNTEAVHPYPFTEVAPGRWRSEVMWDEPG